MDTQRGFRLIRGAFATAIIMMGSMAWTGIARADDAPRSNTTAVYPYQGPGVGSVKTPPFYDADHAAYLGQLAQNGKERHGVPRYYHKLNVQAQPLGGNTVNIIIGKERHGVPNKLGPGLWSSKGPGIH